VWIDQAAKELGASVKWMPFELHPDTPLEGAPKPFTDEQWPAIRERLLSIAARVGLPMNPPRDNVNSRLALEAGELVRSVSGDEALATFHHAVSRAFFVDNENIGNFDVIAKYASQYGVDTAKLREAWADHRFAPLIVESMRAAAMSRVSGVPAFGWPGTRATSGMMEPEAIVQILTATKPAG
jgi:predicted DsbA family dithiol-disulfide isomerase